MTLTTYPTSRRALPSLKRGLRSVAGVAIMIGTVGLGSNLFSQPSQLTSSTSTPLYASATGSSTASCDSVANACSLQTALNSVSSSTPNITIMLITPSSTGDYVGGFTVNTGSSYNVTIENYKGNAPTLNGGGKSTVLTATGSGSLTLSGVTITGGQAAAGSDSSNGGAGANGGGIYSTASLIVSNSTVTGNNAGNGGNGGLSGSDTAGNGGNGGGIYSTASVTISKSTISGNSGGDAGRGLYGGNGGNGGGIYSTASVTISKSTISGNSSGIESGFGNGSYHNGTGGGIYSTASLNIYDSTITGTNGTGMAIYSATSLAMSNSTITENSGWGITNPSEIYNGGAAKLTADLIAGNVITNCTSASGSSFTDSYNVSSDGTCGFTNTTTSASETNLVSSSGFSANNLNTLGNNGGPTETAMPQSDNPAIGFIPVTSGFCPPTDQRGYVPPSSDTTCDAGAVQTGYVKYQALLNQTITFTSTAPTDPVVGGTYAPTAEATSGLPVGLTIASSSSSVCAFSKSGVTFNAVGTCTIDANQSGNSTYAPAPQVTQSITVVAAPQAVTFTPPVPAKQIVSETYDPVISTSSGLPTTLSASPSSVCSASKGGVTFNATGTCTIDANQAGKSIYTQAIQVVSPPKPYTIAPSGHETTTTPPAVRLVTGPPAPPATTTDALPLGLGLSVLGVAGVGYLALDRKRRGNDEAA